MKILPSKPKLFCRLSKSKLTLSAFTLTELLTVIVMVSILAVILLSALGSAKSSALVVNCTSNYRQWGVLANVYASDNRQYLPGTDLKASGGA
jgi:prepilin-type N-terminal cleavage/methylation domain-containing protein